MEVIWTDAASQSLTDVADFIKEYFNESVAIKVVGDILRSADMLGSSPRIGRRFERLNRYGEVRCLVSKYNQIYYHIKNDTVRIIAVWDCRRNPERVLDIILDYFRG